jgi:ATP-dependent RNA helicase DeaD
VLAQARPARQNRGVRPADARRIAADAPRSRLRDPVLVLTHDWQCRYEAIQKYATAWASAWPSTAAPMDSQIVRSSAAPAWSWQPRGADHLRRSTLRLDAIRVLVLDEADEMLDMGFAEDLEAILRATSPERQVALFSATMPARIAAIAQRHLKDPSRVTIGREKPAAGTLPQVRQTAFIVPRGQKAPTLGRVLEFERPKSAIVFCRTRLEVESLTETLNTNGHRAQALHGGMEQRQRDRVMQLFRAGSADLLVATDVAARGLDIDHLSHVINYDVPSAPEAYVHRIGRTGRIGRDGVAITLVDPREQRLLRNIESFTKQGSPARPSSRAWAISARRLDDSRSVARAPARRHVGRIAQRRRRAGAGVRRERRRRRRHRHGRRGARTACARPRAEADYNAVTANDASRVAVADRSHVGSGPAR